VEKESGSASYNIDPVGTNSGKATLQTDFSFSIINRRIVGNSTQMGQFSTPSAGFGVCSPHPVPP